MFECEACLCCYQAILRGARAFSWTSYAFLALTCCIRTAELLGGFLWVGHLYENALSGVFLFVFGTQGS